MEKKNSDCQEEKEEIIKNLELYFTNEKTGQGLPILLPNFVFIRNQIQNFIRQKWQEFGFNEVITPILGATQLYQTSEHLIHYQEYMFPEITKNKECYYLRPMTCPQHCLIFQRKLRSYNELPFRLSENSILFRYETSGSLKGLERVRCLELADHHIFVSLDILKQELKNNFLFIEEILKALEIEDKRIVCSFHDKENKKKYHGNAVLWEQSEIFLVNLLEEMKIEYVIEIGEAAFYGPKIDFEVPTANNKYTTISTIQLDFFLPNKFQLKFLNAAQQLKEIVIIHQSPIGSYQRFIALLLEQKKGKLPLWLIPIQLIILPINNKESVYFLCEEIKKELEINKIRVEIWTKKTLNFRIKEIYKKKIPYYIIVGTREVEKQELVLFNTYTNIENVISKKNLQRDIKKNLFKLSKTN